MTGMLGQASDTTLLRAVRALMEANDRLMKIGDAIDANPGTRSPEYNAIRAERDRCKRVLSDLMRMPL